MIGDTKCRCGCGLDMQQSMKTTLTKIEVLMRGLLGDSYQIPLTCGARCEKHNAEVGGAPNSAHILGLAADIGTTSSQERYALLKTVFDLGIKRIEDRMLNHKYDHIDIASGKVPHPTADLTEYPQNVFIVLP